MGVRKWAYEKPKKVVAGRHTSGKALNGLVFAGTKVGQWTVRPAVKTYDFARGRKK
jgi:hypothetical protein